MTETTAVADELQKTADRAGALPAAKAAGDETRFVTKEDRQYASELLADLTSDDLPKLEIAARWFRKARVEHSLARAVPQPLGITQSPTVREALELAYRELKKHDADYHHRTSIEINNKIVDALSSAEQLTDRLADAQKIIAEYQASTIAGAKADVAAHGLPGARVQGIADCGEWQSIETAPKTNRNTVIVWDDPVMGEAYYDGDKSGWWWANTGPGDYTAQAIYPTLWRPMPEPPASSVTSTQCATCSGRGIVGGFVSADSGYQNDPCPDCSITERGSGE